MKFNQVTRSNGSLFIANVGHLQVQYSRFNGQPKNTLLTLLIDDCIFFGISRCNWHGGDKFSRKVGKSIAVDRMLHAKVSSPLVYGTSISSGDNMLWGCCRADNIEALIGYFNNIDKIVNARRIEKYS